MSSSLQLSRDNIYVRQLSKLIMVSWATPVNMATTATTAVKDAGVDGFNNNRVFSQLGKTSGLIEMSANPFYSSTSSAYPACFGLDDGTSTSSDVSFGFGGIGSADQISIIEGSSTITTVAATSGDIFKVTYSIATDTASYYKNSVLITSTSGHSANLLYAYVCAYYVGDGIIQATFSTSGDAAPVLLPPTPAMVRL